MDKLKYSIAREWLDGSVDGQAFSMHAWSGGRRGTTGSLAEHTRVSYDVYRKENHDKGAFGPAGLLPALGMVLPPPVPVVSIQARSA